MHFSFDVEKVLELFFDGGIGDGQFEENVSFLVVSSSVMEFKIVDREDAVGDEVVDESKHVGRMGKLRAS